MECGIYFAAYLSELENKGDFIDVGAHIGYYSCLLSPFITKAWAFEPDERNHKHLAAALERLESAEIIAKAVSDSDGIVGFNDDCASSIGHIDPAGSKSKNSVEVTTLNTFVEENSLNPVGIKMDIEGYEITALEGSRSVIEKFKPVFLVEYNQEPEKPNSWQGLQDFIESVDYSLFAVSRTVKNWAQYAYVFEEYKATDLVDKDIKMLFLVSNEKKQWFEDLSKSLGTWENKGLHPKAVHSFLRQYL